ncbi:MAG: C39 family peptidase [Pseudomonadota bacterium]
MKKVYLILMLFPVIVSCGPAIIQTKPYAPEVKLDVPFEPNLGETCFSSSFAMVMRYWGKDVHVDDVLKIVGHPPFSGNTLTQLNWWMKKKHGLKFKYLPNSSIDHVKLYLNESYPVIVNQTFSLNENTGHSRVVIGYNDNKGVFIVNDPSLLGPNHEISYANFRELWWKISLNEHGSSYEVYLVMPIKQ